MEFETVCVLTHIEFPLKSPYICKRLGIVFGVVFGPDRFEHLRGNTVSSKASTSQITMTQRLRYYLLLIDGNVKMAEYMSNNGMPSTSQINEPANHFL